LHAGAAATTPAALAIAIASRGIAAIVASIAVAIAASRL